MKLNQHFNLRSMVLGLICSAWSLSARSQSDVSSSLVNFEGVKRLWEQASSDGKSLDISGWSFLEDSEFPVIVAPSKNEEDEEDDISFISIRPNPSAGSTGSQPAPKAEPKSTQVLNTSRLLESKRAALIERLALMKIFLNRAESLTTFNSGSEVQSLNRWKTAAQIELSLMHMALAFDATQWSDKCRFIREANQYSSIASNVTIELDEKWNELRGKLSKAVSSFGFATKTSSVKGPIATAMGLCNSAPPLSKTEQEARARAYVNQFLRAQVKAMIADTQTAIQGPQEAYQKLQSQTVADIPSDSILEFRRDFDNAISNLKLVEQDMMQLYKVPTRSSDEQLPLIEQLNRADLKKLFATSQTDEATLGKLLSPIAQVKTHIGSMLAEIETLAELNNAKVKEHCSGLKAAFEGWNPIERMPLKLTEGLGNCLASSVAAFEAAKNQALDPNQAKNRATLREIEKLSEFVTK